MGYPILGWDVNNPTLGWDVWDIPSWDGNNIAHPGMGWEDGISHPRMGWNFECIFFFFLRLLILSPPHFCLVWDVPSWDGMYGISHLGMEIILPILGWDGKMGYLILGWDGILNAFFFFFCGC
jgi:hypothetical protein